MLERLLSYRYKILAFGHVCWATWNERVMVTSFPLLRSTLASRLKEVTSGAEGVRGGDDSA